MSESTPGDASQPDPDPTPKKPGDSAKPDPTRLVASYEPIRYKGNTARVPRKVGRGAVATTFLISRAPFEITIDFLQTLVTPPSLAARVIIPFFVIRRMVVSLQALYDDYRTKFGPAGSHGVPPGGRLLPTREMFDEVKQPEELMIGCYANSLMSSSLPGQFCLDFIFNHYPRPVVTARIYLAAPQIPILLEALKCVVAQLESERRQAQKPKPPPSPPPPPSDPPQS